MKLGVFTTLLSNLPLEKALAYFKSLGIEMVEIGCGGYPGNAHADPEILLHDEAKFNEFTALLKKYNVGVSALSCHSNPVHPNKDEAAAADKVIRNTILLAEKMGLDQINTFSGCPGDHEGAKYPNWVTCPWPDDFLKILDWQWNEVLIPYWKKTAEFAKAHGIEKIAFEMHPGFCVYNPETLLKLRAAVGDIIGANVDPSHLFWQGMDPVEAIRKLGDAVYYFHGKDVALDAANIAKDGVLDTKHYGEVLDRAWVFRTMGYGHDLKVWKDIVSMLKKVGYDDVISIEHEDSLMSPKEGLEKAINFLKEVLIFEQPGEMWWA